MKRTDKEIKAAKIARTLTALRNAPHAKPADAPIPCEYVEGLNGWLRNAAFKNLKMK